MKLADVLREECIETQVQAASKKAVLDRVAEIAKRHPALAQIEEADIAAGLEKREALGSTGFGKGIAIPHCRLAACTDFVTGLLALPEGAPFESLDGKPVRLVAFIIAPARETDAHIRLLSAISQAFRVPGAVEEMAASTTPEGLRESFLRYTRDESDARDYGSRNLVQIFVQNEDYFHELLQMLTAISPDSVMVIEGRNTGAWLSRMPLFAGFWGDNADRFMRVITAAIEKKLTNETIRRIESVTGHLESCDDVMVVVQDLCYASGRIGA
jgi:nitrogen PTS system EIIA component